MWVRKYQYVNLIGATADDARDIMIEGESGIMSVCPADERPRYIKNRRLLIWPNGARSLVFTAAEPDRLRGKQHEKLWGDELAAWQYIDTWTQALLGLRLGDNPQAIVTTTPRPIKIIKDLMADPHVIVTGGSTYENKANLAGQFLSDIVKKYEGTRLGRQEINAEILDDNPNALWNRSRIDELRVNSHPELQRICIGVDPAVTSTEESCETGIVVAGVDDNEHAYILADVTVKGSPDYWVGVIADSYSDYEADIVIGEVNNGGDLIESLLRTKNKYINYKSVHATRGKVKRAEPIAALYEQGRVHHVGSFPLLEDQMCDYNPADKDAESPDRMDALVWALHELMLKDVKPLIMA